MKRPRLLISTIIIIIFMLTVIRVGIENSISTTGIELMALQEKSEMYKKENAILEEKYLESTSLTKIAAIAEKKGFVEVNNQMYLSTPLPLALNQ